MTGILWVLAVLLVVAGAAGTVLPALPGVPLIFVGVLLAAWAEDFQRIGGWTVAVLAVLTAIGVIVDYAAASLSARRAGASREGIVGAAIGTVAGIFTGFVGLLFMPFIGAMAGEWWALRGRYGLSTNAGDLAANGKRAFEVGFATWLGMMIGTAVKLALVFLMVGLFAAAYFF